MLTVRAPATSANLGSGFDVFGVALERPADVVRVEKADRTTIDVTGAGSQFIPEDPEKNTVGAVAEALDAPAHIQIDKGHPSGVGPRLLGRQRGPRPPSRSTGCTTGATRARNWCPSPPRARPSSPATPTTTTSRHRSWAGSPSPRPRASRRCRRTSRW